jgi:hypothetical protein
MKAISTLAISIFAFSTTAFLSAQSALIQIVPAWTAAARADASQALPVLREREFHQHNNRWSIDIKYPELADADVFNLAVHRKLDSMVSEFKKGLPPATADKDYPDYASYINGTYRAQVLKDGVVSVLFDYSIYVTGAAHPGGELASINYDSNTHRLLALSDLFRPKSRYISRLSDIAIRSLDQNEFADNHAVLHGAGPVESNFKVFTLTDTELVLHFQTYQVAAGAAGSQDVVIPLAGLKPLLQQRFCPEL